MEPITKQDFIQNKKYLDKIKNGAVFIYPTDTIYGIGCNALNNKAVNKIRNLKARPKNPFSIIPPSKQWIKNNCIVLPNAEEWITKLPGPYTLIMELKDKEFLPKSVTEGLKTIGIRQPSHWILNVVKKIGLPVVTTSVNKSGEEFMTSMNNINEDIKKNVDFIIYEGEKKGRPSKIVNLSNKEVSVTER